LHCAADVSSLSFLGLYTVERSDGSIFLYLGVCGDGLP
jgi:hypothetical protein